MYRILEFLSLFAFTSIPLQASNLLLLSVPSSYPDLALFDTIEFQRYTDAQKHLNGAGDGRPTAHHILFLWQDPNRRDTEMSRSVYVCNQSSVASGLWWLCKPPLASGSRLRLINISISACTSIRSSFAKNPSKIPCS
jgi:hypothetical protein